MDAAAITSIGIVAVAIVTAVSSYFTGARAGRVAAAAASDAKAAALVAAQIEADNRLAIARVEADADRDVAETTGEHAVYIAEAPHLAARLERMEAECAKQIASMGLEIASLRATSAAQSVVILNLRAESRGDRAMLSALKAENVELAAEVSALRRESTNPRMRKP